MKIKIIVSSKGGGNGCAGGQCPTIYQTEKGSYLFQGKKVDLEKLGLGSIPSDESIVELPKNIVEKLKIK